jgi:hypothetical protein
VHLLHKNPKYRYQNLAQVKDSLLELRKNIFATPQLLRDLLGHPCLPGEQLGSINHDDTVSFRGKEMSKFSLKYLAKFICEHPIDSISINGGAMPIRSIQTNTLVTLNLRNCGLFSEDLFILSQVMKDNSSIQHINLSKNMLGYTYV